MIKLSRLAVKDSRGRILMRINETGKIAFARFPDMPTETKQKLLDLCAAVLVDNNNPQEDLNKIKDFLDFRGEENEFCS